MPDALPVDVAEVVRRYPHARDAFTQGLLFLDGELYEGTGLYGRSSIRRVELETGKVLQQVALAPEYFGEGIAIVGEELFQLTWESGRAFVYDRRTFALRRTLRYPGEGWGLATAGASLALSDGTAVLRFLDPQTFAEQRRVRVTSGGKPVPLLNALQWVRGELFANIWWSAHVVRIDPGSGEVLGWIDLSGLKRSLRVRLPADAVLNGVAWDEEGERLFVTGKLWPTLFEIRLPR